MPIANTDLRSDGLARTPSCELYVIVVNDSGSPANSDLRSDGLARTADGALFVEVL